jgi:hypothetical protein
MNQEQDDSTIGSKIINCPKSETSDTAPESSVSVQQGSSIKSDCFNTSGTSGLDVKQNILSVGASSDTSQDPTAITDAVKVVSRSNAFAQLVQGWENYMNDGKVEQFAQIQQPLEMLQGLTICGNPAGTEPSRFPQEIDASNFRTAASPFMYPMAPAPLRYTHSTPMQPKSPFQTLQKESADQGTVPPPPIALDPFQRSTSTPSAFRQHSYYSAFGTPDSAFTLASQRSSFSGFHTPGSAYSAFDPVKYYSMALEDMERTSIEVQDITDRSNLAEKEKVGGKRGAASRAARFLSDVRVLRRRRRSRGGRENPAHPSTLGLESRIGEDVASVLDTAVTVITEPEMNLNDTSLLSRNSEISAIVNRAANGDMGSTDGEEEMQNTSLRSSSSRGFGNLDEAKEEFDPPAENQQYEQFDSDVEEANRYHNFETQYQPGSPSNPSFPSYHDFSDSGVAEKSIDSKKMKIKVSASVKPRFTMASDSPSPSRMEECAITHRSSDSAVTTSPQTTRSLVTHSSSGHTTQATNSSSLTGMQSGLSTISETDREVMQANKEGKRRRNLDSLIKTGRMTKNELDGTSTNSSSSASTNSHQYFSLASSPLPLRDGANVPVERFFTNSPTAGAATALAQARLLARSQTASTSSRKSGNTTSPSTTGSVSVAHTSSSTSSGDTPPTFVSYLDREASSHITSFRETMEISSQRATGSDNEEREASPLPYPDVSFEEPKGASQVRTARLDKFRSQRRPPRSPSKGTRPLKTPPPRGSVSPLFQQQLSPPRNIVDHPDSDISRPFVVRSTGPSMVLSRSLNDSWTFRHATSVPMEISPSMGANENVSDWMLDVELVKGRTYHETSIEISSNADAPEDVSENIVTPEKEP